MSSNIRAHRSAIKYLLSKSKTENKPSESGPGAAASFTDTMSCGHKINDGNMSFIGEMTLALDNLSNLEGFACHVE